MALIEKQGLSIFYESSIHWFMRKFSLFLALFLLVVVIAASIAWTNRENILAHFLSRQLHVPVSIRSLDLGKTSASFTHLWIGNPPHAKNRTAFIAETLQIDGTLNQILANPTIIEKIDIDDIYVNIELSEKEDETNWSRILQKDQKKKSSRGYLIRTLILRNLTVEVIDPKGKVKRYPTIKQMEFHDISDETGFPIEEIEKAIFNLMMQDLFKKLQIDQLLKTLTPSLPFPFGK